MALGAVTTGKAAAAAQHRGVAGEAKEGAGGADDVRNLHLRVVVGIAPLSGCPRNVLCGDWSHASLLVVPVKNLERRGREVAGVDGAITVAVAAGVIFYYGQPAVSGRRQRADPTIGEFQNRRRIP
jgi:hypothetical protein